MFLKTTDQAWYLFVLQLYVPSNSVFYYDADTELMICFFFQAQKDFVKVRKNIKSGLKIPGFVAINTSGNVQKSL